MLIRGVEYALDRIAELRNLYTCLEYSGFSGRLR